MITEFFRLTADGGMNLARYKKDFEKAKRGGKIVVGITGQVGSGKSTALSYLGEKGFFTISSDGLAKKILTSGAAYSKLAKRLGRSLLNEDGSINRYFLSERVFRDKTTLKWLERLLHPAITEEILKRIKNSSAKVILIDVPLLFETNFSLFCELTVCVHAPGGARMKRIAQRGWSPKNAFGRMKSQFSAGKKSELSDITVVNDSGAREFRKKLDDLCEILR